MVDEACAPIRVLLAEDMHMVRGALVALLEREPDIQVVAEVPDGTVVLTAARETAPDIAVLDIAMPGLDGLRAAEQLSHQLPECKLLMLTANARPALLREALQSVNVDGFILKDSESHRLSTTIRDVVAGERVIDPRLAVAALSAKPNPLTEREITLLNLVAAGYETAEIATRAYLGKGTVRNYLAAIVTKLGARNRLDAVRIATEADWL